MSEDSNKHTPKFPPWLKKRLTPAGHAPAVNELLGKLGLNTVCAGAHCPNQCECFARGTATFMILGDRCTRACRFCAVGEAGKKKLSPPRADEPDAVAQAVAKMNLRHVVVTCVTRDDLVDGGAEHFARTISAIRNRVPNAVIEVLTSDFAGRNESLDVVVAARPDVFNHNVETVQRLHETVRPQANYRRSLTVLDYVKKKSLQVHPGGIYTKSGLMVGLGETDEEIIQSLRDLRSVGCDILTLGQYLAPSPAHLPVARFMEPSVFEQLRQEALRMGFSAVAAGPFVRSSYNAQDVFGEINRDRTSK